MLEIFGLVHASLPLHPSISLSINEVNSVTMFVDGVTPNRLLQRMDVTQILDKDVDLELSDEELELVAGNVNTSTSDVFYNGDLIVDYDSFLTVRDENPTDQWAQSKYICNEFQVRGLLDCNNDHTRLVVVPVILQQLLHPDVKRLYPNGFNINLGNGQVTPR